jgi:hypothetical protein
MLLHDTLHRDRASDDIVNYFALVFDILRIRDRWFTV